MAPRSARAANKPTSKPANDLDFAELHQRLSLSYCRKYLLDVEMAAPSAHMCHRVGENCLWVTKPLRLIRVSRQSNRCRRTKIPKRFNDGLSVSEYPCLGFVARRNSYAANRGPTTRTVHCFAIARGSLSQALLKAAASCVCMNEHKVKCVAAAQASFATSSADRRRSLTAGASGIVACLIP